MRVDTLHLSTLLDTTDEGGRIRFAGARTILLDTLALGILRKQLIETLGLEGARALLTQLGYAHGWHTAKRLKTDLSWDSLQDWRLAGARLHSLQGWVRSVVESYEGDNEPFAHSVWYDSYEAEQHLLHMGKSEVPTCWTLTGYASGYLSFVNNDKIYCLETECVGMGDKVCRLEGRPKEEWGEAERELIAFTYEASAIEASLEEAAAALRDLESQLLRRKKMLGPTDAVVDAHTGLVVHSPKMRQVIDVARRVAKVNATVLITGESGVGKERMARLLHDASPRSDGPFVAVNCGALTDNLLGSELFGHAKGAFTGADLPREGLFEAAHGGTLFLDEIGEVSPVMQVNLLRVLQEREIRRLGETQSRPVDVRLVAATLKDLDEAVAEGRFREDLLYRLRVVEVAIPPLRARTEDLVHLSRYMLATAGERLGRNLNGFTPEAMDILLGYDWPGNVRELQNAIEHAVVLAAGPKVTAADLPAKLRGEAAPNPRTGRIQTLEEVEREYVLWVLDQVGQNRQQAAEALGVSEATVYRKLKKWGGP